MLEKVDDGKAGDTDGQEYDSFGGEINGQMVIINLVINNC